MRARGVFIIREGRPVVLTDTRSTDIFQEALATFPEFLAGGTTTEEGTVRKLVLVSREIGVPSVEGGSATWSLDHLFLDEAGIPVFVEVKRSSNSEIRRQVVGQMMDYAANGIAYWPIEELQEARSVGWTNKYPSCPLSSVTASDADRSRLFAAFDAVADPPVAIQRT